MTSDNIIMDRQATAVELAQTQQSHVASELPPDSRLSTQPILDLMLERQAQHENPIPETENSGLLYWMKRARCRGVDPSEFYPPDNLGVEAAKAICNLCVVKDECLEYALDPKTKQEHGVWGGASERERRRILRQRRADNTGQST
ncbi:MAG TPA: WhiB family transcriptional regulator [Candidatus Saccharimonadales bacterium]|nr:WhiB family transcriptional regulator [Candidatus Saccharimonadales bacterium]